MKSDQVYAWEEFAEYRAVQQYGRCLGRVLASLPRRMQRLMARPLVKAAMVMAKGIAGAHAEGPGVRLTLQDRETFRDVGLESVRLSREGLMLLREEKIGNRACVGAALELLERIESGLRQRPIPE